MSTINRGLLRPVSARLVLALLTAVSAGFWKYHDAAVEAQRDRYEALQQHCAEREIDALRGRK